MRRHVWAIALALVLALAGCGSNGNDEDPAPEGDVTTVARLVQSYAATVAQFVSTTAKQTDLKAGKCTGRAGERSARVFSVRGEFQMFPEDGAYISRVNALHDQWAAAGWQISTYRQIGTPNNVQLIATDPTTKTKVWIDAYDNAFISASVYSACYLSPEDVDFEKPGNLLTDPNPSTSPS